MDEEFKKEFIELFYQEFEKTFLKAFKQSFEKIIRPELEAFKIDMNQLKSEF